MEGYLNNIVNLKLKLYTNIVFYMICVVMIYEVLLQLLMYFCPNVYKSISRRFKSRYYRKIFLVRKELISCIFNFKAIKNKPNIKNQLNQNLGMLICFLFIAGIKYTPLYQNGFLQILQFLACTIVLCYFFLFLSNSVIDNLTTLDISIKNQNMKNSIQK